MLTNFVIPNKTQVLENEYKDGSKVDDKEKPQLLALPECSCILNEVFVYVYEPDTNLSNIGGKVLMTPEGLRIEPITGGVGLRAQVKKENGIYVLTISFRNDLANDISYLKTKLLTQHDIKQGIRVVDMCRHTNKDKPYLIHYIPSDIEEIQDEEYKEVYGHYPYEHTTDIIIAVNKNRDDSGWYGADIDHREDDDVVMMK